MIMRVVLLVLLCTLSVEAVRAQTPGRLILKGTVADTAGAALPGATILLSAPADSTLVSYARSGEQGAFEIKNVRRDTYLLKVAYVGFFPYQKIIEPGGETIFDVGMITLKPIVKELFEVVIRTAKAPMTIKGDTIEYNTSSFKVPPGSTVEDLLRRLPGVLVDPDGSIKAQGQDVKRVTVDGKSFFGTDPKLATKNLAADAVSKVQIFNDQTEQAKLTGINSGKKEKTVNLELKEEFKKGGFGKITTNWGLATNTGARGELKGNYNKFNEKQQFSAIGLANNTNQTGMSFDDYQDFRGSNSFNWNDDADFGFGGGGGRYATVSSDDEALGIPVGGSRGQGFSRNAAVGVNYNYDTKKTKFSSSYYYNQSRQTLAILRNRQNFLEGSSFLNSEASNQLTFGGSYRVTIRVEQMLDSLNSIIFLHNSRLTNSDASVASLQQLFNSQGAPNTQTAVDNGSFTNSLGMANTLIYRRKFKTTGRTFAASATTQINNADGTQDLNSRTNFFQAPIFSIPSVQLLQDNIIATHRSQYKLSLLYAEPLTEKLFWESFYNFNLRHDEVDRSVFDRLPEQNTRVRSDTLSRYYKNNYLFNRLGTGLRYSYKGVNFAAGGAVQQFRLNGRYASSPTTPTLNTIDRIYTLFVPDVSVNVNLKNNMYIYGGYEVAAQTPGSRQLQPVTDLSNPIYISRGNPNLLPQLSHSVSLGFYKFNPATFLNLSANTAYNYNINQIVNAQTVDPQTLVTRVMPVNITGGQNVVTVLNVGFPVVKTKVTLNAGPAINLSSNLTPVNGIQNMTNTQSYTMRTRLDLTPNDWFTLYANADWGISNTRYSISSSQNQRILNHNYNGDLTAKLPQNLFFNTTLNYRIYRNDRFGFAQQVTIWNMAIYKLMGKAKKAEMRLTIYDLLNRNLNVSQFAGQNYVSEERISTLARYFMLGFTYNMRGVNASIRKNRGY